MKFICLKTGLIAALMVIVCGAFFVLVTFADSDTAHKKTQKEKALKVYFAGFAASLVVLILSIIGFIVLW